MNPLLESLNRWGNDAIGFAGPMLWQSSLLIAALLLLDTLLRRRARAVLRYALWSLVLVKLALPPSLALPTGLGYWLRPSRPSAIAAPLPRAVSVVTFTEARLVPPAARTVARIRTRLNLRGVLLLAGLAGSAILLGFLIRRSWQVGELVRTADPATDELLSLLDDCRAQLGIRQRLRLKLSPIAFSPAVCGLRTPVVLLPRQLAERLGQDQLRPVLLHELIHVKRRDVWVNGLQTLLQMLYWWHPLVWIANARIRRVREEAVDEAVMVALGPEAESYPAALVEVAKLAFARPLMALGLVGIFESKGALQERIRRLVDRPVPRSAKLSVAGIVAVAASGALLLPMAHGNRVGAPAPSAPSTAAPTPGPSVLLNCVILEVTDDAWRVLQLGPPSSVGTNGHQLWVRPSEQFASLFAALSNQAGVFVLARPRLETASDVTGTISVTRATNLNGRTVQLGSVCELTPQVKGTEIDLALKVSLTEMVKAEGDGQTFAANAVGYVTRDAANVRATVPDNGGVLVHNPNVTTSEGRHLLFVVRPVIVREDGKAWPATSRVSPASRVNDGSVEPPWTREVGPGDSKALGFDWFLGNTLMSDGETAIQGGTGPGRKAIQSKLHRIILDEVVFEGLSLPTVLQNLSEQALQKDPDKQGINFLINPNVVAAAAPAPLVDPSTGNMIPAPAPEPLVMEEVMIKISPALRQVRLIDVLEAVVRAADKPIKYTIEEHAVVISQKPRGQVQLQTRIFKVDPNTFIENMLLALPLDNSVLIDPPRRGPGSVGVGALDLPRASVPSRDDRGFVGGGGSGVTSTNRAQALYDTARRFFAAAGVNMLPPNQLYFNDRTGVLMVRATPHELDIIQKAIEVLNVAPPQLNIEAKFIEAPEDIVKRISAVTTVSAPDATNQVRILTEPQTRVLMRALETAAGAAIVSAPKVTTLSGRQTQIQDAEVKTILTGIDPEALAEPGRTASDVTNASPFLSKQVPLGSTLDVIASVGEDGYTVDLNAIASVTEFLGYDKPTNTVTVYVKGEKQEVEPPLPRLRTRQANGKALLYDGQTLLLIGPSAAVTYRYIDKVPVLGDIPVLGRLFRHEGTSQTGKHMLILITPTLIDPAGNAIHTEDNLPFDPSTVPPQSK